MTKKILTLLIFFLLIIYMSVFAFAAEQGEEQFVYDYANLLSSAEEGEVAGQLEQISRRHSAQIVVVTIDSTEGKSINSFINDFYDDNDLGYGDSRDGVLLVVCMKLREFRILSNGRAAEKISLDDIDDMSDNIAPYLSDGDYADAFIEYAELCDGQLGFDILKHLGIALLIGAVIGVIVAFILKAQLRSVKKRFTAHEYIRPGSMNIRRVGDFFLYRNVSKTRRQQSSSSGSGSRSGGGSRNVGGGRF